MRALGVPFKLHWPWNANWFQISSGLTCPPYGREQNVEGMDMVISPALSIWSLRKRQVNSTH